MEFALSDKDRLRLLEHKLQEIVEFADQMCEEAATINTNEDNGWAAKAGQLGTGLKIIKTMATATLNVNREYQEVG